MVRYEVAFDVNGTVHTINVGSVGLGNQYLHCKDETLSDEATVAMLPFDSVEYVIYENMSLSSGTTEVDRAGPL